jgi:hypothetical protein
MLDAAAGQAGTYVVTVNDRSSTVTAERWDYGPDSGNLRLWQDGQIIAEYRYWDSIRRKAS